MFKVKGSTPFKKVATIWCKRAGKDIDTVRFHSNEGVRVILDKLIEEVSSRGRGGGGSLYTRGGSSSFADSFRSCRTRRTPATGTGTLRFSSPLS
jgi:hypothetical protein